MHLARQMWHRIEPVHAIVYFAPEHRRAQDAVGLKGGWMAYFASRAAPLGAVPPEVVAALFYNFAPRMVARALPDAWAFSTPDAVLAARYRAVGEALRRLLPAGERAGLSAVADLLRLAAEGCDLAGRPLFAANAALPWPDDPALRLWHATTLLREHRGDGHVAALQASGVDGCEGHLLAAAAGRTTSDLLQAHRGWTDDEWQGALGRLRSRGLLTSSGALTVEGAALHAAVEDLTDRLALAPWAALDDDAVARASQGLAPVLAAVAAAGVVPYPNAMALPATPPPTAEGS